jgi:DNA-binding protein HU-beta
VSALRRLPSQGPDRKRLDDFRAWSNAQLARRPPPVLLVLTHVEDAAAMTEGREDETMAKVMSKSEIVQKIAEQLPNNLTRDEIKGVLDALADVGHAELRRTGAFLVPGFAKFEVTVKPATEEREGINPFTKEPMTFKAKPASKVVRARPTKALKDAL